MPIVVTKLTKSFGDKMVLEISPIPSRTGG